VAFLEGVWYFCSMAVPAILQIPNLLSLVRIALVPVVGYYLSLGDEQSSLLALILLIVAGITDGLDGYLARKLKQVSPLGIALDPVADKIFAGALVILLVLYRNLPLWLAGIILGRDLLIIAGGLVVIKKRTAPIPSNLTGKYTFVVIVFLLASYIIRFDYGMTMMTYLTIVLVAASTVNYGRVFTAVSRGRALPSFHDKTSYKVVRLLLSAVILVVYFYHLLEFLRGRT
jgi:CDP-diacylglycerol--glycerol-3-phosphate 3-phosphatidyltransferase